MICSLLLATAKLNACPTPGTYSIGPTGNYTSITAAISDIQTCGSITGAYVFELQASYVSTAETFPLVIPNIAGASSSNSITIRPATGATNLLISNNTAGTLRLDGAQYLIIDGRPGGNGTNRELTIQNTLAAATNALLFVNDASYNQIVYCNIKSAQTDNNSNGTICFSGTTGTTGNDNNLIDRCAISDATSTPANAIFSAGSTSSVGAYNSGNTISNNLIYNFYSSTTSFSGIYLFGSNTDWTISGNSFYQTSARTLGSTRSMNVVFIYNNASYGGNHFQVLNNYVGGNAPYATGTLTLTGGGNFTPFSFYTDQVSASDVSGNIIRNVSLTTTSTTTVQRIIGIFTGSVSCTGNSIQNIQYDWSGGNAILSAISAGITNTFLGNVTISSNTISDINLAVTGATSPRFWAIYVIDQPGSYVINSNLINNISSNTNNTIRGIASLSTSNSNTIHNNTISNFTSTATGGSVIMAGIFTQNNRSYSIQGNTISNLSTSTSNNLTGNNAAVSGINLASTAAGNTIKQNTISAIRSTTTNAVNTHVLGIVTGASASGNLLENKVYDVTNSSTGTSGMLAAYQCLGGNWTVANNMISVYNAGNSNDISCYGMYDNGASGARKYYFNSVVVGGAVTAGAAISACLQYNTAGGSSADIKNNILHMQRTGSASHFALANGGSSFSGFVSNNNILNNSNTASLGMGPGQVAYAFDAWKTAGNVDAESYTAISVPFANAASGDLHINTTTLGSTPTAIESKGAVQAVLNDIDNDARPGPSGSVNGGGTNPDIGADEIDAVPDDKAPVISYTSVSTPNCSSNQNIYLTVTDDTGIPLSGSFIPHLYYRKNGGVWFTQPATFTSGNANVSYWTCTIIAADLAPLVTGDVVEYFATAQDLIQTTPNVGATPSAGFSASDVLTITTDPGVPDSYLIDENGGHFWIGVNNQWSDPTNWCGGVPSGTSDVTIPSGLLYYPIITGVEAVKQLTIDPGAAIQINASGTLQISGNVHNNGVLVNDGTIELNGTVLQQFPGAGGTVVAMENLLLNNPDGINLNQSFSVSGTLTPATGILYMNNSVITLSSTAFSTARVGTVGGSIQYNGTGDFIVERNIPARRAWRLLAAPIQNTGAPSINAAWQESVTPGSGSQNPKPGYGTHITGGSMANGFDQSPTNTTSIRYFTGINWSGVPTSTNHPSLSKVTNEQGYMLFVRGDRSIVIAGTNVPATNTTLRMRGRLNTHSQTINCNGFTVVGNPFASTVNFHHIAQSNTGLPDQFYMWDPALGGSYNVGAWVSFSWNGTNYTPNVATGLPTNGDIPSGAAFVVNYSGTIQMDEADKTNGSSNSNFRVANSLSASLYAHNADGTQSLNDGVVAVFNEQANAAVDEQDVLKNANFTENMSMRKANQLLAIEQRPGIMTQDSIVFNLEQMRLKNYHFLLNFNRVILPPATLVRLHDRFLQTRQVVEVSDSTVLPFTISAQPGSYRRDRFQILFEPAGHLIDLKAIGSDKTAQLNWTTTFEQGMQEYVVERSTNGIDFTQVATVQARGNQMQTMQYVHVDENLVNGHYHYRIRIRTQSHTEGLSNVVEVDVLNTQQPWNIYPNPVSTGSFSLFIQQPIAGFWKMKILDGQGRLLQQKSVFHPINQSQLLQWTIPKTWAAGIYYLELTNPLQIKAIQRFEVQ